MTTATKKCCGCKERFGAAPMVKLPIGWFCTMQCATTYARAVQSKKREKIDKAKHRDDLKRIRRNPRAEALLIAQKLARISRADDDGYCTCVSCGCARRWNEWMDGGHFIAKSKSSYWMLSPDNIHPQCKSCNDHGMKYGTAEATYTIWMINKYGEEFVNDMIATKGQVIKRSAKDYDDYIAKASAEIEQHKKRLGIK